jgi:hypothetical protein
VLKEPAPPPWWVRPNAWFPRFPPNIGRELGFTDYRIAAAYTIQQQSAKTCSQFCEETLTKKQERLVQALRRVAPLQFQQ